MTTKRRAKKNTLGTSPAVLRHAIARRKAAPLVFKHLAKPRLVTLQPDDLANIGIDERYQRAQITTECHRIVHALKSGGSVPAPITVAVREDGSQWCVDGQQRWWACLDCQHPLQALVYAIQDWNVERDLFNVLNDHVALNAESIVHAHSGPTAAMIREAADKPGHALCGHVGFGRRSGPYSAPLLARGMLAAATGIAPVGAIKQVLARCDFALQDAAAIERAQTYLALIPLIFPTTTTLRYMAAIAIGRVAHERWRERVAIPSPKVYERLKRVNWDTITPTREARQIVVMEEYIKARWPAVAA
jgi:hypothetical protein